MDKVTISKEEPYRMHLPKVMGESGFRGGKAPLLSNKITVTIVRPDINLDSVEGLEAVKKSLEIIIQDLDLQDKLLRRQK